VGFRGRGWRRLQECAEPDLHGEATHGLPGFWIAHPWFSVVPVVNLFRLDRALLRRGDRVVMVSFPAISNPRRLATGRLLDVRTEQRSRFTAVTLNGARMWVIGGYKRGFASFFE
jgi:hypothetical protein